MHDIIDNRDRTLVDALVPMLSSTDKAKLAVGYFFLSGFNAIQDHLSGLSEIRILMGNTTTRETIEQIAEGVKRLDIVSKGLGKETYMQAGPQKKRAEETAQEAQEQLSLADQSDENEALIGMLARMIQQGKVKVRVYARGTLHAKAYIFDYRQDGRYEKGIAVIGSSNLTLAGISSNTELNVVVHGNDNHQALSDWFERLWNDSVDFDALLLNELKRSWAGGLVTPYDIYMKTLFNLTKDALSRDPNLFISRDLPQLLDFQRVAVEQAAVRLEQFNGVFIADVVGLGKTYIASALANHFQQRKNWRTTIICPPALMSMWQDFRNHFEFDAEVLSTGMLSEDGFDMRTDARYRGREIVIVDESHYFRNHDTLRYQKLYRFLRSGPYHLVLLTATPRNNTVWDIYNQIKLFHPDDAIDFADPPNMREFFNKVEKGERHLPDFLTKLLVRRRRKDILENWAKTDKDGKKYIEVEEKKRYFPKRDLENLDYSIDAVYQGVYDQILTLMKQLTYARYGLWNYVQPDLKKEEPYVRLERAGKNLRGLIRALLLKRLESSVYAFQETVKRMIGIHRTFLEAIGMNLIPAGEEAQRAMYEREVEPGDQADFFERLEEMAGVYKYEAFESERLKGDIDHDREVFEEIFSLIKSITPAMDDKLQTLKAHLGKAPLEKDKVLIFTQYADTAQYLYRELEPAFHSDLEVVSGDTKNVAHVAWRFAPQANKYEFKKGDRAIWKLVATDVLSEGLNLQDCWIVINYDLHWNPVRLIQRVGRVDRIGSEADKILVFNFMPETKLDKHLGLTEKLKKRIQEIHDTIGEDAKILDKSERLNEKAMYSIYQKDSDILDAEDDGDDFGGSDIEDKMRRLKAENPEEYGRIAAIPDGVRSARAARSQNGAFLYCQADNYNAFYLIGPDGAFRRRELSEVLREIECGKNEPVGALPPGYNASIMTAVRAYRNEVEQLAASQRDGGEPTKSQNYVVTQLQACLSLFSDDGRKANIAVLTDAFHKTRNAEVIKELNRLMKNSVKGEALYGELDSLFTTFHLGMEAEKKKPDDDIPIVRIICSEALL